ncbi:hypothetical protein HanPSC8_Chr07g0300981 [Helianthus annuus]|nr:hypothetical protein HanPSC8_Chr07g0300981 [Helianthus annuus]
MHYIGVVGTLTDPYRNSRSVSRSLVSNPLPSSSSAGKWVTIVNEFLNPPADLQSRQCLNPSYHR